MPGDRQCSAPGTKVHGGIYDWGTKSMSFLQAEQKQAHCSKLDGSILLVHEGDEASVCCRALCGGQLDGPLPQQHCCPSPQGLGLCRRVGHVLHAADSTARLQC